MCKLIRKERKDNEQYMALVLTRGFKSSMDSRIISGFAFSQQDRLDEVQQEKGFFGTGMVKKKRKKDAYLRRGSKEPNIRKVIRFGVIAWITKRKKTRRLLSVHQLMHHVK